MMVFSSPRLGWKKLVFAAGALAASCLSPGQSLKSFGTLGFGETISSISPYVIGVFPGLTYTLAFRNDGTFIVWGDGREIFEVPANDRKLLKASSGADHVLGLHFNGTVVAWGKNSHGQCNVPPGLVAGDVAAGNGFSVAYKAASPYSLVSWGRFEDSCPSLDDVYQVAAGDSHGVALTSSGDVTCWGDNTYGQLNVPSDLGVTSFVAAGANFTVALKPDYTLQAWGDNSYGQCDIPAEADLAASVVAGANHVVAITIDTSTLLPKLVAWGRNTEGQATCPTGFIPVMIGAAGNRSYAIDTNAQLHEWGQDLPASVDMPTGLTNVIQVSGNYAHALALRANGTVAGWGLDTDGQLNIPIGLTNVVQVAAGYQHSAALKSDGSVVCWGSNLYGQSTVPSDLGPAASIAAGATHTVAALIDGTVVSWGDLVYMRPPVGLTDVTQVAAGDTHEVALKSDGTVVAWGSNVDGETTVPSALTDVVQIAADARHNIALKSDGTVVCWGSNSNGESTVPSGLTGVAMVAADRFHSYALKTDGTVIIWGTDGGNDGSVIPASVTHVSAIFAGGNTSYALSSISVSVASNIVIGSTGVGTVSMPFAPGPGGIDVTLSSNKSSITVPATVHIDANMHSANFPITSDGSSGETVGVITATLYDTSTYTSVIVTEPPSKLYGISVDHSFVVGGSGDVVTGTVYTYGFVPADVTVTLTSDNPHAVVPSTVTIHAGEDHADFPITHTLVATSSPVTITGTNGSDSTTGGFFLDPINILGWNIPAPFYGDSASFGTVYIDSPAPAGYTLMISSDNPALTVPTTVTFLEGETSADFTMEAADIADDVYPNLTFTDSAGNSAILKRIRIRANDLVAFGTGPRTVEGGSSTGVTGTLTLRSAPLHDATVTLVSDAPGAASVPVTVIVPAGQSKFSFPITTHVVTCPTTTTLTATRFGRSKTAVLDVTPATIQRLTTSTGAIIGGSTASLSGTVFLKKSHSEDVTVQLCADDPSITVPATVTVLAGETSVNFPITHGTVMGSTYVTISATTAASVVSKTITVNPNPVLSNELSQTTVVGGSATTITGTVSLKAAVGVDTLVSITSAIPNHASVPATVTVVAGQSTATYVVTHHVETIAKSVGISATHGGVTKKRVLLITP